MQNLKHKEETIGNLFEAENYNVLFKSLVNSRKEFIILTLVLEKNDKHIKSMIRKFIKKKSQKYLNLTFIYYVVQKDDLGKINPILGTDLSKYPKMYHIFDVEDILGCVESIDNDECLDDLFSNLEDKFYNRDLRDFLKNGKTRHVSYDDGQNSNYQSNESSNRVPKPVNQIGITQNNEYTDPKIERKKFIDKLLLLRSKADEYFIEFLEDCKKRKKEEEKMAKKEKKQNI